MRLRSTAREIEAAPLTALEPTQRKQAQEKTLAERRHLFTVP